MLRDYVGEFRKILEAATAVEDAYSPARVAEEIFKDLADTDPDLLIGYLLSQGAHYIRWEINLRDGAKRNRARRVASRQLFAQASQAADAGNKQPLTRFLSTAYTVENGLRMKLADMSAYDLIFVSNRYGEQANSNALQCAFFRALATKVGSAKVGEVLDEHKITQLWLSLGN